MLKWISILLLSAGTIIAAGALLIMPNDQNLLLILIVGTILTGLGFCLLILAYRKGD